MCFHVHAHFEFTSIKHVQELEEGVKSKGMKVIVIRKGQLQLYAGQPLADVEMSLRSILE